MSEYIDLLITDGDLTLDAYGEPITIDQRASIAQDVKHLIIESGLLIDMLAERDSQRVRLLMNRLEEMVDDDLRIKPGTAKLIRRNNNDFFLTAETIRYGLIEVYQ
ncbi:MAG: DUF2590 family protein [Cellvibrionaceae bacterium]